MTYYLEQTEKELILRKYFFKKKLFLKLLLNLRHEYPLAQSEKEKKIYKKILKSLRKYFFKKNKII